MLQVKHIRPHLEKIAQSMIGSSVKSSSSAGLSSPGGRSSSYTVKDNNYQGTIGEARTNADLQPMNRKISKPLDRPATKTRTKKNMHLSHLNDRRMQTPDRPRIRTRASRINSASPLDSAPKISPVI